MAMPKMLFTSWERAEIKTVVKKMMKRSTSLTPAHVDSGGDEEDISDKDGGKEIFILKPGVFQESRAGNGKKIKREEGRAVWS